MCSKIRYPHPGERKNEWSFSGEDDLKQWVLTADSDWGEGYRWLASPMMAHCYDEPQSLPYFSFYVSSPWLSLACEVLHNLRLTHWAIVFSKGSFQRGNTSCPIFQATLFLPLGCQQMGGFRMQAMLIFPVCQKPVPLPRYVPSNYVLAMAQPTPSPRHLQNLQCSAQGFPVEWVD